MKSRQKLSNKYKMMNKSIKKLLKIVNNKINLCQ